MPNTASRPVIVFDGLCVLCSANAQFILKNDSSGIFRLAAMQGEAGAALMRKAGVDPYDPETFLVFDQGRVLRNSDAIIAIALRLGWPWKIVGFLRVIPQSLRDSAYRLIARSRYRIFGKRDVCWVAPENYRDRIL